MSQPQVDQYVTIRNAIVEEIIHYIATESEIMIEIVPGETKHQYGLRMLRELREELRREFIV